jgi:hypothetical protein
MSWFTHGQCGPAARLSTGARFALSAIGYRGAIPSLADADYRAAATFTMTTGLIVESVLAR